jgi:hypothetical protein
MKVVPVNEGDDENPHNPQNLPGQVVMVSCKDQACPIPSKSQHSPGATEGNGSTTIEKIQGIKLRGPFPSQNVVCPHSHAASVPALTRCHVQISSSLLWAQRPVVIMIVRRLGCPLCRHSFQQMHRLKDEFDKIGVDLLAISNQVRRNSPEGFSPV